MKISKARIKERLISVERQRRYNNRNTKIIDSWGEWELYANGDIVYDRVLHNYWIDIERLKDHKDLANWISHLRKKSWWNSLIEGDLEYITQKSWQLRGIDEDPNDAFKYTTGNVR